METYRESDKLQLQEKKRRACHLLRVSLEFRPSAELHDSQNYKFLYYMTVVGIHVYPDIL